ncbi:MAG TPA: hypothetical protein VKZ95_05755 [Sphingobacteriaceae bacterium]|nr:hypothetical protein [Sphingobacteriaceae bacterium]
MIFSNSDKATAQSNNPSWLKNLPAEKVIEWRQHIHQNPELSFEEVNTSQYVADILESFDNIEVKRPTKTSVLGILKGAKPGITVVPRGYGRVTCQRSDRFTL